MQKCLSSDGSRLSGGKRRRRSLKELIGTKQATDKERSTNVRVTDVLQTKRICTVKEMDKTFNERSQNAHLVLVQETLLSVL